MANGVELDLLDDGAYYFWAENLLLALFCAAKNYIFRY